MADPGDVATIDELRAVTGFNIEPVVATKLAIHAAIDRHYEKDS